MNILYDKLKSFKQGFTIQTIISDEKINYTSKYFNAYAYSTSNKKGGYSVINGKQWTIVIDLKSSINDIKSSNPYYELSKSTRINISPIRSGEYKGIYGLRLYDMSHNPTREIVYDILRLFDSK